MTAVTPVRTPRAWSPRAIVPTEPELTLDVLGPPILNLVVMGNPVTQGSKEFKGHVNKRTKAGKVVRVPLLLDDAKALGPWRDKVAAAALSVLPHDWVTLDEPLVADLVLSLPRLKATPTTKRTLPHTKGKGSGDMEKFQRATNDALGTTLPKLDPRGRMVFADDARITHWRRACKVYAGDVLDPDALRSPGAVIRLWRYPATLLGPIKTLGA